jgi:hypothetical protein
MKFIKIKPEVILHFLNQYKWIILIGSLIGLSLILSIAAIAIARNESFTPTTKYAPNAMDSGWYTTLHRECAPGNHKCRVKDAWGHESYFCSSNCTLKPEHLKGEELKEPLPWDLRFA